MNKSTTLFRVLHIAALGIAVLAFGAGAWEWLSAHRLGDVLTISEFANLCGLLLGTASGIFLLWRTLWFRHLKTRTTVALYVLWMAVFAWFWFNRFTSTELHAITPETMAQEQLKQTAISVGFFLVWVGLFLIFPIQTVMLRRQEERPEELT